MQDLSGIVHHLIGISFLDDDEKTRIYREWEFRFREEYTDWVCADAQNGKVMDIVKQIIELRKAYGHYSLAGLKTVLAVFYDLRKENVEQQTEMFRKIQDALAGQGVIVQIQLQFGYVGNNPSPDSEAIRQRVKLVASKKISRFCMVGKSAYADDGGNNWKAAVILLDMLRRCDVPNSLLPMTGGPGADIVQAVGFLRYAEHSQNLLNDINAKIEDMEYQLEEKGGDALRSGIMTELENIYTDAPERFPIDARKQPLHPDMLEKPKKFDIGGKSKKRFQEAEAATVSAVQGTGDRLVERMEEYYVPSDTEAEDIIRGIISKQRVSLGFINGIRDLKGQLQLSVDGETHGSVYLSLPYNEKGYVEPIDQYLRGRRDAAVLLCRKKKLDQLVAAFGRLQKEYVDRIPGIKTELNKLTMRRKSMIDRDEFLQDAITVAYRLEGCFTPRHDYGTSRTYILWREQSDREMIENIAFTDNYRIDGNTGHLKAKDEGQIKALIAFFAKCTDVVVNDLIIQES